MQPKETGLYDVRFTPSDPVNFLPATAQVHIQVGATPAPTHTVRVKTEGAGSVILRSGDLTYPAFGPFYDGMNLTLQAITSEGNRFKGFEIKGVTYATNPYELEVKVLSLPSWPPVVITYAQPSGGTLTVTDEKDGTSIRSGSSIPGGTEIHITALPNSSYKLSRLKIGDTDYTAQAIEGKGTIVRAMSVSRLIAATFTRITPPDPDPTPTPDPNPSEPGNPDPASRSTPSPRAS